MKFTMRALAAVAAFAGAVLGQQPKVDLIEVGKLVHGSISMDKGSPWCAKGQRMVWLIGHDSDEHPSCEVSPGVWKENRVAELPLRADSKNNVDDGIIDRHDCKTIYANDDNLPDVVCMVGANKGRGVGYHELLLTQPDGSLQKVLNHGLHKYNTMRTRMMNVLRGPNGEQLIFLSARGTPRKDRRPNVHRMFRVTRGKAPYFVEINHDNRDPWMKNTVASSVKIGDINGDGLDDIIVTNERDPAMMFIQNRQGYTFTNVNTAGSNNWRAVRIADLNGDGIADLVATTGYRHNRDGPFLVQVFKGTGKAPYFDLRNPVYHLRVPYPAGDVEILDVNGDGRKDIYVVQADEARGHYCGNPGGGHFNPQKWYGTGGFPPKNFVAPKDTAPDILLMGTTRFFAFNKVKMQHSVPGCGFLAERFGNDRTMILSHGEIARAGNNVVLTWSGGGSQDPPEPTEPVVETPKPGVGNGPVFTVPFTAEAMEYSGYRELDNGEPGDCSDGNVDSWFLSGEAKNDCQSDCAIGWTTKDEYMEYDFETAGAMRVQVTARVASKDRKKFKMQLVGEDAGSGNINTPGGGWNAYKERTWDLDVSSGKHTLRVLFMEGAMNFCSVSVKQLGAGATEPSPDDVTPPPPPPPGPAPTFTVPFAADALDYTGFSDVDKSFGNCNDGNVDAMTLPDSSKNSCQSDCIIGWTSPKEYVEYAFRAESKSTIQVSAYVASDLNKLKEFRLELVGESKSAVLKTPGDGWFKFEARSWKVDVEQGDHVLRVVFLDGLTNFCSVKIN